MRNLAICFQFSEKENADGEEVENWAFVEGTSLNEAK